MQKIRALNAKKCPICSFEIPLIEDLFTFSIAMVPAQRKICVDRKRTMWCHASSSSSERDSPADSSLSGRRDNEEVDFSYCNKQEILLHLEGNPNKIGSSFLFSCCFCWFTAGAPTDHKFQTMAAAISKQLLQCLTSGKYGEQPLEESQQTIILHVCNSTKIALQIYLLLSP